MNPVTVDGGQNKKAPRRAALRIAVLPIPCIPATRIAGFALMGAIALACGADGESQIAGQEFDGRPGRDRERAARQSFAE